METHTLIILSSAPKLHCSQRDLLFFLYRPSFLCQFSFLSPFVSECTQTTRQPMWTMITHSQLTSMPDVYCFLFFPKKMIKNDILHINTVCVLFPLFSKQKKRKQYTYGIDVQDIIYFLIFLGLLVRSRALDWHPAHQFHWCIVSSSFFWSLSAPKLRSSQRDHVLSIRHFHINAICIIVLFPHLFASLYCFLIFFFLGLLVHQNYAASNVIYDRVLSIDPLHVNTICNKGLVTQVTSRNPDEAEVRLYIYEKRPILNRSVGLEQSRYGILMRLRYACICMERDLSQMDL